MKISECNHFRIRDGNVYDFDVEKYVESIEKKFNMDIRKLPQWKEVIRLLHVSTTDCKMRKQEADLRKQIIIKNLYTQYTRPSPWDLNQVMARTHKKWRVIEEKVKQLNKQASELPQLEKEPSLKEYEEMTGEADVRSTAHFNTEVLPTETVPSEPQLKSTVKLDDTISPQSPGLPVFICMNQHKLISPMGSKDTGFHSACEKLDFEIHSESSFKEWQELNHSSVVRCYPEQITIRNNVLKQQSLNFSVVNCTTEYLNLQYKRVTDKTRFRWVRVLPNTPKRLYPGMKVNFKMIFRLWPNEDAEEFVSSLYFKVGRNTITDQPSEAYLVPIGTIFLKETAVTVSETVQITPALPWHINGVLGYPSGEIKISIKDNRRYNLNVTKRIRSFGFDSLSSLSGIAVGPSTESMIGREVRSDVLDSPDFLTEDPQVTEKESVQTIDFIGCIVGDIVDLSLEPFLFERTYCALHPQSTQHINVYLTKPEHIGYHQCYYDLHFSDPDTGKILITKTVVLLAEVLPHPIKFVPEIMDMTDSPITHGFCQDRISIYNNHKVYSVTVSFKLTTKMKKLFHLKPMETLIDSKSVAHFTITLCSRDFKQNPSKKPDFCAHFTVKVKFRGHEAIYKNVPPFFYEIIVPCAFDFKQTYNEKYYKEVPSIDSQERVTKIDQLQDPI